jgi:negative regulator of replication initiation
MSCVERLLYTLAMPTTIGFRPTEEDQRIIDAVTQVTGESASDALRRALRLLDREMWLRQARADMAANADENIAAEPDAW